MHCWSVHPTNSKNKQFVDASQWMQILKYWNNIEACEKCAWVFVFCVHCRVGVLQTLETVVCQWWWFIIIIIIINEQVFNASAEKMIWASTPHNQIDKSPFSICSICSIVLCDVFCFILHFPNLFAYHQFSLCISLCLWFCLHFWFCLCRLYDSGFQFFCKSKSIPM